MKKYLRYGVIGGIAILLLGSRAGAVEIPLLVTEPVGVERKGAPVTGGIPVEPLQVKDARELVVVDQTGKAVHAQISPIVTREDGTVSWVLVDFIENLEPHQSKHYKLLKKTRSEQPLEYPVKSKETGDEITVENNLVKLVLSRKNFNLFKQVWVDSSGKGNFKKALLAPEQPDALFLIRGSDKQTFSTRAGKVEKVSLEDSGPIRTTVRVDGTFGNDKGDSWLKYTLRLTLWAGAPDVRVLYAIRNVNPDLVQQEQIRRGVLAVKLGGGDEVRDYLVGASDVKMSRVSPGPKGMGKGSQWHRKVRLSQRGPMEPVTSKSHRRFYHLVDFDDVGYRVEQFQPGNRHPFVDVGFSCDGWMDLKGTTGGCQLWLRNFTHDTPKQIEAHADGTLLLDLIPEYDGKKQPYYANGGFWLGDRSHQTYEMNFRFHTEPFVTEKDLAKWKQGIQGYVPPLPDTSAKARDIVQNARHRLQLRATPEWYTRTGQMWGVMPTRTDEKIAAEAMGRKQILPGQPKASRDRGLDFLHYENFHYRSEWDEPRDCIVEYLRTGHWHYGRRAHTFARNYRDLGIHRTDGLVLGKRNPGAKGAGAVPRWGKFCGCHNYGAGTIDMGLITGDRSYLDAGIEYGYQQAQTQKVWGGFGGRNWGRQMASVLRTYVVTRDPKLKTWLMDNCRPRIPDDTLRADGRALVCGKKMGSWMLGLCTHAIWHNWVLNKDNYKGVDQDDYRDQIIGIARNVAKYWFDEERRGGPYYIEFDKPKPGKIHINGSGISYTSSCVDTLTRGYLLTGDPALLSAARKFWHAVNGEDNDTQRVRLQNFLGMGSHTFWCRQLIYALAHPRQDNKAPAAVKDLKAEILGSGKVKISWTAPKGDASIYQLKHAPCPMVPFDAYKYPSDHQKTWTWWAGYNVAGEPVPGKAGQLQQVVLDKMPAGTRYFCLRSRDHASNESPMSNVVNVDVR